MKFLVLSFSIILSCNLGIKAKPVSKLKRNYRVEISYLKKFAKQNKYSNKIAFMVDYSLHSGKQRFFVVNLKKGSIIDKGLVCHGSCKGKSTGKIPKVFSNTVNSNCTSLGMAVVAERAWSGWGKNFKYWIDGLEKSNKNMRKRIVVLHAWDKLPNKDVYPQKIATSWGCPTVSVAFLDKLDGILKKEKRVLLYSFK